MNDLTASLAQACKDEGIDITPSALTLLAEAAEGSQDYAERLLEQLASSYADPLTEDHVLDMLRAKHQPTVARDQQTPFESHTKKLSAVELLSYGARQDELKEGVNQQQVQQAMEQVRLLNRRSLAHADYRKKRVLFQLKRFLVGLLAWSIFVQAMCLFWPDLRQYILGPTILYFTENFTNWDVQTNPLGRGEWFPPIKLGFYMLEQRWWGLNASGMRILTWGLAFFLAWISNVSYKGKPPVPPR